LLDGPAAGFYRFGMARKKKRATATASRVHSGGDDCTKGCVDRALEARKRAQGDYEAVRDQCNLIGDPTSRANCLQQAASALTATLQTVQADYELCRRLCDGNGRSSSVI
jgi:hypothetical protein